MCPKRALLFVNGSIPDPAAAHALAAPGDLLIGVDGGTRHLLSMGLVPAIVLGDLDSLGEAEKEMVEAAGSRVEIHPREKDETDLELALRRAIELDCAPIVVAGGLGGRLDQTLANLSLLTDPDLAGRDIRLDDGVEAAFFTRSRAEVHGAPGDTVSLIPWGGEVSGVSTEGLRWCLRGETLYPHRTRGISNEMLAATAEVKIDSGLLLIVHRRRFD
jgi:thiamine pyrophosphokinase